MLIEILILFLSISILFYVLFGGADFGAGVLEIISGTRDRETIAHAIGPVWEANHVWLILVVVILFMGFPKIYTELSTSLHIPLLLMLLGVVLRGTAFAYMHYDAIKDASNRVYNRVFKISSLVTPLFLGMITGAAVLGRINPEAESFAEGFIDPWFNLFSFSVGLFTLILFTFLAAVYLIGETKDDAGRTAFIRSAKQLNGAAVVSGIFVFMSAEWGGLPLFSQFLNSVFSLVMVTAATAVLPFLWRSLSRAKVVLSRILAALQVIFILLAWFWVQYPVVIRTAGPSPDLTFHNTAAPEAVLWQLVLALAAGTCIILPCLYYLMRVFKGGLLGEE